MDADTKKLVDGAWQDLRQSYGSLTREWLEKEAEKQLAGERPTGGPGVFLNEYLKRAGLIT